MATQPWMVVIGALSAAVGAAATAAGVYYQKKIAETADSFNRSVQTNQWRKDWEAAYTEYKSARNKAKYYDVLGVGQSKTALGESNAVYGARVGRWYDVSCFPATADTRSACEALEDLRSASRQLLSSLDDPYRNEKHLAKQAWAEALNVFLVNAPLDAANYKHVRQVNGQAQYSGVRVNDFGAVVMLLLASAEDANNLRALDKMYAQAAVDLYSRTDITELKAVLEQAVVNYQVLPDFGGFRATDVDKLQAFLNARRTC